MGFQRVANVPTARGIDADQFAEGVELAGDPANLGESFKWDAPVRSKSIKTKLVEHFNLGNFNEHGVRVDIGFKPIKEQVEETYEIPAETRTSTQEDVDSGVAEAIGVELETAAARTATRIVEKETSFEMYFFGTKEPKPERKPRAKSSTPRKPRATTK